MSTTVKGYGQTKLQTAIYLRISREDGDKTESLSISNQRMQLLDYIQEETELELYEIYTDENYTGSNFERPAFKRLIQDIDANKVQCVIVKDLSRLGRNLAKTTEYINDYFPAKKVRFIAVNDAVDKDYLDDDTSEDMMIDFKNMFNGFYPKDIARKVRSTFRTKQARGQFIGAFACYGYRKDIEDHNKLVIDEYASGIVKKIFGRYINGMGKNTIAKTLNEEQIPCPSVYKNSIGLRYHNAKRLEKTFYWTYASVSRILENEMYLGNMVQNKSARQISKKKAVALPKEKWIIVENTHDPIIDTDTWNRTQNLLKRNTRQVKLNQNIHKFAGFIQCGDCGRAMVKINRGNIVWYNCGSYNRYGKGICSIHSIKADEIEQIVLNDLSVIIRSVQDIKRLIEEEQEQIKTNKYRSLGDTKEYAAEMERIQKKKDRAYHDYSEDLISIYEYIKYKNGYEKQIGMIQTKMNMIRDTAQIRPLSHDLWIERLLQYAGPEELDREIIADMVSAIYVYEDKKIKIVYNFSSTALEGSYCFH